MSTLDILATPLGELARSIPGATQVFHEYRLDFCCGGKHALREAAAKRGIDPQDIADRLAALQAMARPDEQDWRQASTDELVAHLLQRYHAVHREQLPELIRLAARVEQVHGDRPECPRGLAALLVQMAEDLESHMVREEEILFPLLREAGAAHAQGPIAVMRAEHDGHGETLQHLEALTNAITLPRGACNTWRALYLGLATLRDDLMQHIHLENNVLFDGLTQAHPHTHQLEATHG